MSRVGPLTEPERKAIMDADTINRDKYTELSDAKSAAELLAERGTAVGQVKEKLRRFGNLFGIKS